MKSPVRPSAAWDFIPFDGSQHRVRREHKIIIKPQNNKTYKKYRQKYQDTRKWGVSCPPVCDETDVRRWDDGIKWPGHVPVSSLGKQQKPFPCPGMTPECWLIINKNTDCVSPLRGWWIMKYTRWWYLTRPQSSSELSVTSYIEERHKHRRRR